MNNVLITILSRAGSRGCPGKHMKIMNGKPLIVWTMEHAEQWGKGSILVSTDDDKVCCLSVAMGISWVPQRPQPTDITPKIPAIRNALLDAETVFRQKFETIVDLDATAPLRTIEDIKEAYQRQKAFGCDCVLSVVQDHGSWNCLEYGDHGLERVVPVSANTRQQAPEWLRANASIYVYKREFLIRETTISPMDGWVEPYVMPEWTGVDVNSEFDFELVEFIMKRRMLE